MRKCKEQKQDMVEETSIYCEGINDCERKHSKINTDKDKTVREEDKDTTIMTAKKEKGIKEKKQYFFII
jgi:hypothetical protein